jgi:hypothetical protein
VFGAKLERNMRTCFSVVMPDHANRCSLKKYRACLSLTDSHSLAALAAGSSQAAPLERPKNM